VISDDLIVATGGYYGNSLAVRAGGAGNVTATHRLWHLVRHNGGIGTGVVKDGSYYYHNSGGVAYCLDTKSGKTIWESRLPGAGKSWGSFLLAGTRIYSLSQAGDTVVFEASREGFKLLAQNDLGEHTNSSPAPAGKDLLIRTHQALWCVKAD
jgi:outer membrane protein assembly factor BamB